MRRFLSFSDFAVDEPSEVFGELQLAGLVVPSGRFEPDGETLAKPKRRIGDIGLYVLHESLMRQALGKIGFGLGKQQQLRSLRGRIVKIDEIVSRIADDLLE